MFTVKDRHTQRQREQTEERANSATSHAREEEPAGLVLEIHTGLAAEENERSQLGRRRLGFLNAGFCDASTLGRPGELIRKGQVSASPPQQLGCCVYRNAAAFSKALLGW